MGQGNTPVVQDKAQGHRGSGKRSLEPSSRVSAPSATERKDGDGDIPSAYCVCLHLPQQQEDRRERVLSAYCLPANLQEDAPECLLCVTMSLSDLAGWSPILQLGKLRL